MNKEAILSETVGEYNYDYDIELLHYNNIKNKVDPFEWTKDEEINKLLNYEKRKVYKKTNKNKATKKIIKKLSEIEIDDCDKDDTDSEKENGSDSENESSETENKENKEENEFDIELDSDVDEIENEEYEDFSD